MSRDVCSAGTIHSINVFLDRQMRKLGFRFSTPPLFLQRDCSATSMSWWRQRGSSFQLFSWHFTGKAGQGQFWRFTFCDPHR